MFNWRSFVITFTCFLQYVIKKIDLHEASEKERTFAQQEVCYFMNFCDFSRMSIQYHASYVDNHWKGPNFGVCQLFKSSLYINERVLFFCTLQGRTQDFSAGVQSGQKFFLTLPFISTIYTCVLSD